MRNVRNLLCNCFSWKKSPQFGNRSFTFHFLSRIWICWSDLFGIYTFSVISWMKEPAIFVRVAGDNRRLPATNDSPGSRQAHFLDTSPFSPNSFLLDHFALCRLCVCDSKVSLLAGYLSVPSKIPAKLIIRKISEAKDQQLRQEQAGFWKGGGCTDQIFTLRNQ